MRRRRLGLGTIGILAAIGLIAAQGRSEPPVRVGSFNIRMFPEASTDHARVAQTIAQLDADIFGVQEIRDEGALRAAVQQASALTGRDYRFVLSRCRHWKFGITTGVVWDASRWTLREHRDYPELMPDDGEYCGPWQPGTLGLFVDEDGRSLGVLSVHLPAFPRNYGLRRDHWRRVLSIQRELSEQQGITVLAVGDYNSTGFTGEPEQEREFITDLVDEAGFDLLSADVECTEYYRPRKDGGYLPSVLDHVVATDGTWSAATALGICERMACRVVEPGAMDRDYYEVSDHCPIYVDGAPAD